MSRQVRHVLGVILFFFGCLLAGGVLQFYPFHERGIVLAGVDKAHAQAFLRIEPETTSLIVGDTIRAKILLEPKSANDVAMFDIGIAFNQQLLQVVSVNETNVFKGLVKKQVSSGKVRYAKLNPDSNVTTNEVEIGTVVFRAIKSGTASVTFESALVGISGQASDTDVFTSQAVYTIACSIDPGCTNIRKALQLCTLRCDSK